MVLSRRVKAVINAIGSGLAIAAIVFVTLRLASYLDQISFTQFAVFDLVGICCLALVYGCSNYFLAKAWERLLRDCEWSPSLRWVIYAYGTSQLSKYVPGNIFHLASRQAIGMAAGYPSLKFAKTSFWELVLISVAGALYSLLTLPAIFPSAPLHVSLLLFLAAVVAGWIVTRSYFGPYFARAYIWQSLFLGVSGLVFVAILYLVGPGVGEIPNMSVVLGAYVVAWLVGLLTPGAPAGIGVRETVLLFLLGPQIAPEYLLLAVLVGRIVTVMGDVLFFFFSSLIKATE